MDSQPPVDSVISSFCLAFKIKWDGKTTSAEPSFSLTDAVTDFPSTMADTFRAPFPPGGTNDIVWIGTCPYFTVNSALSSPPEIF
jgi:hypothetical protein